MAPSRSVLYYRTLSIGSVLPHEPFTVNIRGIFVRTQRSQKNAFGAALHTTPFDRMTGDEMVRGLRLY
jgi:hypothetical protein